MEISSLQLIFPENKTEDQPMYKSGATFLFFLF